MKSLVMTLHCYCWHNHATTERVKQVITHLSRSVKSKSGWCGSHSWALVPGPFHQCNMQPTSNKKYRHQAWKKREWETETWAQKMVQKIKNVLVVPSETVARGSTAFVCLTNGQERLRVWIILLGNIRGSVQPFALNRKPDGSWVQPQNIKLKSAQNETFPMHGFTSVSVAGFVVLNHQPDFICGILDEVNIRCLKLVISNVRRSCCKQKNKHVNLGTWGHIKKVVRELTRGWIIICVDHWPGVDIARAVAATVWRGDAWGLGGTSHEILVAPEPKIKTLTTLSFCLRVFLLAISAARFSARNRVACFGATTISIQNFCVVGRESLNRSRNWQLLEWVSRKVLVVVNSKA